MKEHLLFSSLSVALGFGFDRLMGTRLASRRSFWIFLGLMTFGVLFVDGWLTWRRAFVYSDRFVCGLYIGTIPVEDFLFGYSYVTFVVVLWEWLHGRYTRAAR